MAKNSYVGVEAGSGRLKIAETRNGTVVRFAAEDMPDDMVRNGEIVQWEALGDFLKRVRENCASREAPYMMLDGAEPFEEDFIPLLSSSRMI